MKRLLVLLALLGVLAAPGRLAAQAIPVGVGGQLSAALHVPIVVPIVVDMSARPERLGSFSLRIQWNPAVLSLSGGSDGSFGGIQVNEDSLPLGVARLAGVNAAGVSGRITLVNLQLVPLVKDTATITLTLTGLFAAGTFADLAPLAVVTNGLFCPARGLWGDIDGDGAANSRDALIALSNAVGLDVSAFDIGLGDVNSDGNTNATDALIILSNAVGMDVSRFRVLRIAGGACSADGAVALSMTPTTTDTLVRGQSVQFEAWVADSVTGALQAVPNPTWKSSAPLVLAVGPDGYAVARDSGTVVVTALRGTRDSVRTTMHIVARRTSHWVDVAAVNAKNRLGTAALPFGSVDEGKQFAQDGDTLRIRLGSYELQNGTLTLDRPIVLIGDTAADGSRPVLVPDSTQGGYDGEVVDIWGQGRHELQYLDLGGAPYGVYVDGTDCVLLRGVRMRVFVSGLYSDAPAHCIRIERSTILGPDVPYEDAPPVRGTAPRIAGSPAYYNPGPGVEVDGQLDTLTIEDTEIGGFDFGVDLSTMPDSTTIRRSSLHDFSNGAVVTGYGGCYDCSPPSGRSAVRPAAHVRPAHAARAGVARSAMDGASQPPAVVIESSRLARSPYSYLVYLEGPFRRVAFAHNWMSNPGYDVVNVYSGGPAGVGGYLSLLGDSIVAPPASQHGQWLGAQYFDSLTVDSLHATGFSYGSVYDVALVRMTNSVLRDLNGDCGECTGTALEVNFGYTSGEAGGVLQIANDSVVGDVRQDARGYAFRTEGARVEADRVTAVNLDRGIYADDDDSSVTVTNSLFRHVSYPIEWYPSSYPAPYADSLTVRGSTFSGFSTAITADEGVLVADSNAFVNGDQAIYFSSPMRATVTRNQSSGTSSGIEIDSFDSTAVVTLTDNVFSGIESYGISAYANSGQAQLQTRYDVRRNTVTCDAVGASEATGVDLGEADLVVLDNHVNGCYAGIRTYVSMSAVRGDSIEGNTVTAPASAQFGIGVAGNVRSRVRRNIVTGAATGQQQAGLIDLVGNCFVWACPETNVPVALVDSNTVTGGTVQGIHAHAVDSLQIVGNTVTNLNSPSSGYSETWGGISVTGYLQYLARIVGNVVKTVAGNGIAVNRHNGDASTVEVDSNVIAAVTSSGVYFQSDDYDSYSGIAITHNLITQSQRDGIRIGEYAAGPVAITGNNIFGNLPYGADVYNGDRGTINAQFNFWGDSLGPTCSSECPGVTGDSLSSGFAFDFDNWLTSPSDTAPTVVPAPRFLAQARPAPVLRAVRLAGRADAPMAPRDRFAAERAPAPRPAAANAQPATGPLAQRRAAADRARAEQALRVAQRLQQLRAEAASHERARQAAHAPPRAPRSQGVKP